jgi:hypothetical protein
MPYQIKRAFYCGQQGGCSPYYNYDRDDSDRAFVYAGEEIFNDAIEILGEYNCLLWIIFIYGGIFYV